MATTKVVGLRLDELQQQMLCFLSNWNGETPLDFLRSTIRANFIRTLTEFLDDPAVPEDLVALAVNTAAEFATNRRYDPRAVAYQDWSNKLARLLFCVEVNKSRRSLINHFLDSPALRNLVEPAREKIVKLD